jgi:hypothetical protein
MEESAEYPSPSFRLVAVIALCIGIGAGAWAFFALIIPSISDDGKTVYIQADKSPIKTTPDQPGGMEIPHQDKLVFNAVNQGSKTGTDRLAPAPEQPIYSNQASAPVAVAPTDPSAPAAPAAVTPGLQPGQTDAPGAGSAPSRTLTMPVALGRAIEPAPGSTPATPVAAPQAIKVTDPATSFDFKDGGLPPSVMALAQKAAPNADAAAQDASKAMDKNEVLLAQDPSIAATAPNAGAGTAMAFTTDEKPVLPSPQKIAEASPEPTGSDDADGTADDEPVSAEDNAPLNSKKAAKAASKPEDEPVTFKPSPAGSSRYQLASYADKASAQRAIGTFGSKYSGVVSKSSLTVVAGMANGKQVYRVQGSAGSKDEASAICGRVKAKGGTCVPIR